MNLTKKKYSSNSTVKSEKVISGKLMFLWRWCTGDISTKTVATIPSVEMVIWKSDVHQLLSKNKQKQDFFFLVKVFERESSKDENKWEKQMNALRPTKMFRCNTFYKAYIAQLKFQFLNYSAKSNREFS